MDGGDSVLTSRDLVWLWFIYAACHAPANREGLFINTDWILERVGKDKERTARRVFKTLKDDGIIHKKEGYYFLTEKGEKLFNWFEDE